MCVQSWRQEEVVRCGVTDVFDVVSNLCTVSRWVAFALIIGMLVACERKRRAQKRRDKYVYKDCCWQRSETERRRVGDVFDFVRGGGILSRWLAQRPHQDKVVCKNGVRQIQCTQKQVHRTKTLLVPFEGEGIKKCGLAEVLVFFENLYLSAAGGEMWLIRRVCCCFWVKLVLDVGVGAARIRYYSFYGRDFSVCCSSVEM